MTSVNSRYIIAFNKPSEVSERVFHTYAEHTIPPPPPPFIGSKLPLYFLISLTAAALLLFTLLANHGNAAAQTPTVTFTPTLTPTNTSATPAGGEDVSGKLNALEEKQEAQQAQLGIIERLAETLQALIDTLVFRVDALERGYHPTITPSPTPISLPTVAPTQAPGSTPVPTAEPTATPTLTPTATLASSCIRKIGLGWLTGAWNADCLSDKTPPTAKAGTRYARFYTFTLDTPAAVTVSIASNDVANTYLYLLEGVGNEGAVVNRGDSRITEQLQAGAYTIEATTYNLQTSGNFTLTLDITR